jgi:hypothetical protein
MRSNNSPQYRAAALQQTLDSLHALLLKIVSATNASLRQHKREAQRKFSQMDTKYDFYFVKFVKFVTKKFSHAYV